MNRQIQASQLRVVSDSGEQLGVMSLADALRAASDRGLDLVEISPQADPPVAKIIDYGKFKYEKEKAYKENKRKQKLIVVKEIKIKPQIDKHDLSIKKKRVLVFLEEGKKVKVILVLRGRQKAHAGRGIELMNNLAAEMVDVAIIEKSYAGGMTLLLTPKKI